MSVTFYQFRNKQQHGALCGPLGLGMGWKQALDTIESPNGHARIQSFIIQVSLNYRIVLDHWIKLNIYIE